MTHIGTIVVLLVLLTIIILIVRSMLKDKAAGKSTCGCDCSHCGGVCHCMEHQTQTRK